MNFTHDLTKHTKKKNVYIRMDYLTFYDGPDTSSPVITKLCGNIWMERALNVYSTGPQLTAVFSSQANSTGSFGFTAAWTAIGIYFDREKKGIKGDKTKQPCRATKKEPPAKKKKLSNFLCFMGCHLLAPCSICVPSGRGTCSGTNTCVCNNRYTGAVCENGKNHCYPSKRIKAIVMKAIDHVFSLIVSNRQYWIQRLQASLSACNGL